MGYRTDRISQTGNTTIRLNSDDSPVTHFCPICCDVSGAHVLRRREKAQTCCASIVCDGCNTRLIVDTHELTVTSRDRVFSPSDSLSRHQWRMAVEDCVRYGEAVRESDCVRLIQDPFSAIARYYQEGHARDWGCDRMQSITLTCVALCASVILLPINGQILASKYLILGASLALVVSALWNSYAWVTRDQRYVHNTLIPNLVRCLDRLPIPRSQIVLELGKLNANGLLPRPFPLDRLVRSLQRSDRPTRDFERDLPCPGTNHPQRVVA